MAHSQPSLRSLPGNLPIFKTITTTIKLTINWQWNNWGEDGCIEGAWLVAIQFQTHPHLSILKHYTKPQPCPKATRSVNLPKPLEERLLLSRRYGSVRNKRLKADDLPAQPGARCRLTWLLNLGQNLSGIMLKDRNMSFFMPWYPVLNQRAILWDSAWEDRQMVVSK